MTALEELLATLIARFADPDAGAVRIGGADLRDMDEKTLYSTVSFVFQDAQLLGATVRENIALGRPGATDDQGQRHPRQACRGRLAPLPRRARVH